MNSKMRCELQRSFGWYGPLRPYKRGTWFGLVATDKSGEINVKFWGGDNKDRVKRLYNSFKVGDVIQVRLGNVEIYEDKPQISINETSGGLRRCSTLAGPIVTP